MPKIISEQELDSLPNGSLREIASQIGRDNAIRLAISFGGRELYFPINRRPLPQLSTEIGQHSAKLLAELFAGNKLEVPAAKPVCARWMYQAGLNKTKIAAVLRISRTSVRRYLADN